MRPENSLGAARNLSIGCLIATGLVASIAVLRAPPAEANFPGGNGLIAYVVNPNFLGEFDLFAMNADGSEPYPLTSTGDALSPTWSADGRHIAFHREDKGIWVIEADGSGLRQVSKSGTHPAWSPDGRWIAFRYYKETGTEIVVIKSDGGKFRSIAEVDSYSIPAWSPDGSLIAFDRQGHVWVMSPDGSSQRSLTAGYAPEWSPDGERIAFIKFDYSPSFDEYLGNIMVMDSDGTEISQLTSSRNWDESDMSWSPDGNLIAVESSKWIFNSAIYAIDVQTGAFRQLTSSTDSAEEWYPAWQPLP